MSKSLDEVRGLVRDRALKFETEGCYNCHYCGFDCRESCILQDVLFYLNDGAKDIDVPDKSATDICVGDNERTAKVTLSAEPERKKGNWIVKDEDWRKELEWDECSECGFVTTKQYNFCPNCGADMWGEE